MVNATWVAKDRQDQKQSTSQCEKRSRIKEKLSVVGKEAFRVATAFAGHIR